MVAVRRTDRKKRKSTARNRRILPSVDIKGLILALFVLTFLLFTLGALVYVVFFQTVIVIESIPDMHWFLARSSIDSGISSISY
ncbi:MAG: hypothetical protein QNJ17_10245 [Desulfocapsaceae bacterium]|nr:hypothetical protein [Desulfocapsaceae bacterium]